MNYLAGIHLSPSQRIEILVTATTLVTFVSIGEHLGIGRSYSLVHRELSLSATQMASQGHKRRRESYTHADYAPWKTDYACSWDCNSCYPIVLLGCCPIQRNAATRVVPAY